MHIYIYYCNYIVYADVGLLLICGGLRISRLASAVDELLPFLSPWYLVLFWCNRMPQTGFACESHLDEGSDL